MNETYIKEFILDGNFLKEIEIEKVEDIMIKKKLNFISAILELNLLDKEVINKIIGLSVGIPRIDLKNVKISFETYIKIPEAVARTKKIIPFKIKNNEIYLATTNNNLDYDELKQIFPKMDIKVFLTDESDLNKKILEYQKLLKDNLLFGVQNNLKKISKVKDFGFEKESDLPSEFQKDIANNYYTEKFIKELLEYAKTSQASHIYFTYADNKVLVSFRIFGRNYPIMEIEKDTIFSISLKLKKLSDINFDKKEKIQNSHFLAELNGSIYNLFVSIIKTVSGEAITIELAEDLNFGTDFITISSKQKDILYKNLNDEKGFYIIAGEKQSGKTRATYALIEEEIKKNKEIYSIENNIEFHLNSVNQVLLEKGDKKEIILSRIIQNKPDLIAIDYIKPYILKTLFNYVNFGGKIILGIKNDIKSFTEALLDFDFEKAGIVRNFNILLDHKKFKKLNSEKRKEVKISKSELSILKKYISEKEILELLKKENFIDKKILKIEQIKFYSQKVKKNEKTEYLYVRGVIDLGIAFENSFLNKESKEKIKNNILNKTKKAILENALLLASQGEIDFKEIIKFLAN